MGMCKGCGNVFSSLKMNDGFCESCDNEETRQEVDINGVKGYEKLTLKKDNIEKVVKVGFSWRFLILGFWYPLVRKDFKNMFIVISILMTFAVLKEVANIFYKVAQENSEPILIMIGSKLPLLVSIATLIFLIKYASKYNKIYVNSLIKKGFTPADTFTENKLKEKNYI